MFGQRILRQRGSIAIEPCTQFIAPPMEANNENILLRNPVTHLMAFCVEKGLFSDATTQSVHFKPKVSEERLEQHLVQEGRKMLDTFIDTISIH